MRAGGSAGNRIKEVEALLEWRAVAATRRGKVTGRRGAGWFCRAIGKAARDHQLKLVAKGEPAEAG